MILMITNWPLTCVFFFNFNCLSEEPNGNLKGVIPFTLSKRLLKTVLYSLPHPKNNKFACSKK